MLWVLSTQEQLCGCPAPAPKMGEMLSDVAGAGLDSVPETKPTVQGKCLLCACSSPVMPLFQCQ